MIIIFLIVNTFITLNENRFIEIIDEYKTMNQIPPCERKNISKYEYGTLNQERRAFNVDRVFDNEDDFYCGNGYNDDDICYVVSLNKLYKWDDCWDGSWKNLTEERIN